MYPPNHPSRPKYCIILISEHGFYLAEREAMTMKEAKIEANYLLSDQWARAQETTHLDEHTEKVEIRNLADEVVWDKFLSP